MIRNIGKDQEWWNLQKLVTSHLVRLSQDRLANIFFQMGSLIPDEYRDQKQRVISVEWIGDAPAAELIATSFRL